MKDFIDFLKEKCIPYEENADGKKLCSFRVGGKIRVAVRPRNAEQIRDVYGFLKKHRIKNALLGKGSNIIVDDRGYEGVVVLLNEMSNVEIKENVIDVGAGASMQALAVAAQKSGLLGLEFAHGIPGSVGGGIYMNAGAYGGEICLVLESCTCFDKVSGETVVFSNEECGFSYRRSVFQQNKNLVILGGRFSLSKGDPSAIKARMDELKASRLSKQPLEYPSAGSTFKRPEGLFAGKLIEDAGLKGYTIGGAQVSEKHAGFIINRGTASATDVKKLIEYVMLEVYAKFGVRLEREVEYL